jgi:hypothetical protein
MAEIKFLPAVFTITRRKEVLRISGDLVMEVIPGKEKDQTARSIGIRRTQVEDDV